MASIKKALGSRKIEIWKRIKRILKKRKIREREKEKTRSTRIIGDKKRKFNLKGSWKYVIS